MSDITYDGYNRCHIYIKSITQPTLPIHYRPSITKVYLTFSEKKYIYPNLPPNITHLAMYYNKYNQQVLQIPKTVIRLYFYFSNSHPITISPRNYNNPIILPPNIKYLSLSSNITIPITITDSYPNTIELHGYGVLSKYIIESPIMYYLLNCNASDHVMRYNTFYLDNIDYRVQINIYNKNKRQQGLFDYL